MPKLNLKQHLLTPRPAPNYKDRRKSVERNLINAESALGRTLFGAIPAGRSREFAMKFARMVSIRKLVKAVIIK